MIKLTQITNEFAPSGLTFKVTTEYKDPNGVCYYLMKYVLITLDRKQKQQHQGMTDNLYHLGLIQDCHFH